MAMTRVLLTAAVVAFYVLGVAGMWWGWRNRRRRQAHYLPSPPVPPPGEVARRSLVPDARGMYLGTTTAGDWQDRIVIGGLGARATATMRLTVAGLLMDRVGAEPLWIPAESLVDAWTDRACAGRVLGADDVLMVRWRLGDRELDSGFRGADRDGYPEWLSALRSVAASRRNVAELPEGSRV